MNRQLPWFLILIAGVLLVAPTPLGRLLLDLLGGLTLAVLLLPFLLAGAGALAFQLLRRRVRTCTVCGLSSMATTTCPACGAPLPSADDDPQGDNSQPSPVDQALPKVFANWLRQDGRAPFEGASSDDNLDVSDVTIDVESKDVDSR